MASLVPIANAQVRFGLAAAWCGMSVSGRGFRDECPTCGSDGYKGYPDHGWCFSCRTYFTPVRLLAAVPAPVWSGQAIDGELEHEDVARLALARIGYVTLDWAGAWDAPRKPDLDIPALGEALRTWCAAQPGWGPRLLDERPARALSLCLGLLDRVKTEQGCETWLARSKQVMTRVLAESPDMR